MQFDDEKIKSEFGLSDKDINDDGSVVDSGDIVENVEDDLENESNDEVSHDDVESSEETEQENEDPTKNLTETEKEAWKQGWRPKDQFEGDPESWVSAREFVRYGKLQNKFKELESKLEKKDVEFDNRFKRLNEYHKRTTEDKIKELRVQQRTAIEEADVDAYDHLQKKIDDIASESNDQPNAEVNTNAPVQNQTVSKPPILQEWEEKNKWINDPEDPRAIAAKAICDKYITANSTNGKVVTWDEALAHVDSKMSKFVSNQTSKKAAPNPMRSTASVTEARHRGTPPTKGKRTLTMADLTPTERSEWNKYGSEFWNSQKEFLEDMAIARK